MPVGVVPKENDVFDHMKSEIGDLPDAAIGPVIRYYQADEYVVEMIRAFNAETFEAKPLDRRILVIDGYFELGDAALEAAFEALRVLDDALPDTDPALTPERQRARDDLRTRRDAMRGAGKPAATNSDDDDGRENHARDLSEGREFHMGVPRTLASHRTIAK